MKGVLWAPYINFVCHLFCKKNFSTVSSVCQEVILLSRQFEIYIWNPIILEQSNHGLCSICSSSSCTFRPLKLHKTGGWITCPWHATFIRTWWWASIAAVTTDSQVRHKSITLEHNLIYSVCEIIYCNLFFEMNIYWEGIAIMRGGN